MRTIDIMFPVYIGNLHEIEPCVDTAIPFFTEKLKDYDWKVVFAINGRNPEKLIELIGTLNQKHPRITYDYAEEPGKGSGVIHSWSASTADIVVYMDVDLATDLGNFPMLIDGIEKGYDLCIGSRYHPKSEVERSFKRKLISIIYHKLFMKLVLGAKTYSDAQCGFKAVNQKVIRELLPLVKNRTWFFESELMFIAQRKKFAILEIPVKWKESKFSGLTLYKAIWEFITSSFTLVFRRLS